jgi:predicted outer membrane protein
MLRRIPRMLRRALIVAVLLAISATVYQAWSAGAPGAGGWTQTQFGPLSAADRDLIVKVRLAGLWEGPTGQQAEQQASSEEVQDVGRKLAAEHAQLDEEVRNIANQLGVLLPSSPNTQQVAWMNEISAQTGSDYDRRFIQITREAHGAILPAIAQVRSGTQNELVREFAATADEFVTRHHGYLESTGLVDYSALPSTSPGLLSGGTNPTDLIVPGLVFAAALLAAIALFWALRQKNAPRRERVTVPDRAAPVPGGLTAVAALPAPRRAPEMTIDQTGPIPAITDGHMPDPGPQRWAAGAPPRRSAMDSGPHQIIDPLLGPPTGTLIQTGPQQVVSDTGSHRAISESGAHRLPKSRARHSTRR